MKVSYKHTEVYATKRHGQNFLLDANVSRNIVDAARLSASDRALEIGPGFGALTKWILEQTAHVAAVELDADLAAFIRTEFPSVQLIEADFLSVSLQDIAATLGAPTLRVLGNVPYSITSPILFKLLDNRDAVHSATLMIQDEVAKRLSAKPRTKEYGILAVQLQAFAEVEYCFKVSRNVFKPRPTVDSAVVHLAFRHNAEIADAALFRKTVRAAFAMRRKTLENNLKPHFSLAGLAFNFTRRAEEFSVPEFAALSNILAGRALTGNPVAGTPAGKPATERRMEGNEETPDSNT